MNMNFFKFIEVRIFSIWLYSDVKVGSFVTFASNREFLVSIRL